MKTEQIKELLSRATKGPWMKTTHGRGKQGVATTAMDNARTYLTETE